MKAFATPLVMAIWLFATCGCKPEGQYQEPANVALSGDDFIRSCMAGDLSAVRAALDAGVDPDVYYSDGNTTCMIQAAAGGNLEIIRALIEAGADPDLKRTSDGYAALMTAALQGNAPVVRALIEGGADLDIANNFDQDAAAVARLRGHDTLADEIVEGRTTSTSPAPAETTDRRRVTAAVLGDDWPLTIQEGELDCPRPDEVVIWSGGRVYALNGRARSNPEYEDLERIWRDNPRSPGTKIPPSELIRRGLVLCN